MADIPAAVKDEPIYGPELVGNQILDAIERICGDDWCADAECRLAFYPEEVSDNERVAIKKLLAIYEIAHSYNAENSCHHVHDDWRSKAQLETAIGYDTRWFDYIRQPGVLRVTDPRGIDVIRAIMRIPPITDAVERWNWWKESNAKANPASQN